MKVKTITAKIRDAVPVSFKVDDNEMVCYKNIEIPAALKELEMKDFGFKVKGDGKIEFSLHFEKGILPKDFPAPRPKVTRAEKATAKAMKADAPATIAPAAPTATATTAPTPATKPIPAIAPPAAPTPAIAPATAATTQSKTTPTAQPAPTTAKPKAKADDGKKDAKPTAPEKGAKANDNDKPAAIAK